MNRKELFSTALKNSEDVFKRYPFMFPLQSIIEQLKYLIDVDAGATDRSKLSTINIGQVAARDIDEFDEQLSILLHKVSAEVRAMNSEAR